MNEASSLKQRGFIKTYLSGFLRAAVVALFVIAQFAIVFFLAYLSTSYGLYIYVFVEMAGIVTIIGLVNNRTNPSFKIGWLVVIALLPIAGLFMYYLWGRERSTKRIRQENVAFLKRGMGYLPDTGEYFKDFEKLYPNEEKLAAYMQEQHFPLMKSSHLEYLPDAETAFDRIIEDLEQAEKYIFLSFFIIAEGVLWEKIKKILLDKAEQGIEIKIIYDDFGSMFRTDKYLWNELREAGISVEVFNPIHKYLAKLYMNYRNHQKIVIVDGRVGYTGGFNLADEYINAVNRFGKWKDNGIRVEGECVYALTCTFLSMWGMIRKEDVPDFEFYRAELPMKQTDGYCQFISDGPENNPSNPIVSIMRQLIYSADKYLYISTPYLVLEDDIADALVTAAQSGVDVRIITPGIPDKKMVFQLTRYNYGKLLQGGVKVYEYAPGFIHAKTYITDGYGMVGTANLDFRSMYLHYECGEFIWNRELIEQIRLDYLDTVSVCRSVSYEDWLKRPAGDKTKQWVFNIFSSLT